MARVDSESEDGRPNLTLIDVNSEEVITFIKIIVPKSRESFLKNFKVILFVLFQDINIADRMVSSGFAQYCSF